MLLFLLLGLSFFSTVFAADSLNGLSVYSYAEPLLLEREQKGESWAVEFYSLSGDSIIFQHDSDRRLIPASVAKLVTSAAVLNQLGPDFRLETVCSFRGKIANGTLKGDLIFEAAGDPMMTPNYVDSLRGTLMRSWAEKLQNIGITEIKGDIVVRTRPFQLECAPQAWELSDINQGYAPAVDGFGFNSNVCHLGILPGEDVDSAVVYVIDPPYAPLRIESDMRTLPSDDEPYVEYQINLVDTAIFLSGGIPKGDDGQYLWVPIQNPALYFGRAFQAALDSSGINFEGDVLVDRGTAKSEPTQNVLFVHKSAPLRKILSVMNKESDNFIAESMLHLLGAVTAQSGGDKAGLGAISFFLDKLNVSRNQISLVDGCGLGRRNLCSARGVIQLLKGMYHHANFEEYKSTLSVGGVDGTLGGRFGDNTLRGNIFGKTGTLTYACNLAGYLTTSKGEQVAFAMLCNNYESSNRAVKWTQDRILEKLITGKDSTPQN